MHQLPRLTWLLCLVTVIIQSCAINKDYVGTPPDHIVDGQTDKQHTIYFLGQSDRIRLRESMLALHLAEDMKSAEKKTTLLLLGNNSLRSVAVSDSSKRAMEKRTLQKQRYEFFNDLKGKYYAVPGVNEWSYGGTKGVESLLRLEEFIEDQLDQGDVIRPSNGCPGPEEIEIGNDLVLLLIDTQWLFHNWEKPGIESGCETDSELDFYINLEDAVLRNMNKRVIVAGYHNLAGNGRHGGYFSAGQHLIPLPALGSMRIFMRSVVGTPEDLSSARYKVFIKSMKSILKKHQQIIYLSAHERTLEYHKNDQIHMINSGSYSKGVEVGQKNAHFASGRRGYGKLIFLKNGQCVLEFWGVKDDAFGLLYQKLIFDQIRTETPVASKSVSTSYIDSTITRHASGLYTKKGKKPGMLGNNYRKEWATEVSDIPYFDLNNTMGGFKILKRGGGQQTKSLRLERSDKKQYVLRSIEKYPAGAVPGDLRNTIAADIVTDQISAAHPYGAFAIPKMAAAAGIYHTNPKLVYLPSDSNLGIYQHTFSDGLYLFEERPAKNWEDYESFGFSEDIESTFDVLKKIRKDSEHYIDQEFTLKTRLFDILIGDWDRHDDQWRWASFRDDQDFVYYRPIPRDRDQAFFWSDGWLLNLASHNWGLPKFQGFHDKIRDVSGLSYNARHFDRSFINEPDRALWIKQAKALQESITDEVIEAAIRDFPPEIFEIRGEEIIRKLKNRRDDLLKYAEEYYSFLAQEVDVLGSNKTELFEIERINQNEIRITMYLLRKKDESVKRKVYERQFNSNETREVRLFGFDGDDTFIFSGEPSGKIKIRVIGGEGKDQIIDTSAKSVSPKKILVYDTKSGTKIEGRGNIRNLTSDKDQDINNYNRKEFKFNMVAPLLYPQYNPDDGLFLGAGILFINHGFRKDPNKSLQIIKANIAPKSGSYEFSYTGRFTEAVGKWNAIINANIFAPSYTDYFYGAGNETSIDKEKFETDHRYYSARYLQYIFYPELERFSKDEKHRILFGGGYQTVNVKSSLNTFRGEQDRFIITYANSLDYDLLDVRRHYLALYGSYTFDNTDNNFMPLEGFRWNIHTTILKDIDDHDLEVNYRRLRTDLSYYYSFGRFLNSTLAIRVGGAITDGTYEFYQAAKSGGTNTFRGSRKFRFQGEHMFYQNTDLRVKLMNIKNPVIPVAVGITLFHDFGRVWVMDDPSTETGESDKMHRAYGAGLWLAPLNKVSFGIDYSKSTMEESAFFLRMGFFF